MTEQPETADLLAQVQHFVREYLSDPVTRAGEGKIYPHVMVFGLLEMAGHIVSKSHSKDDPVQELQQYVDHFMNGYRKAHTKS